MGDREISRRAFLARGATAGGAVTLGAMGATGLAGCSSTPSGSTSTTAAGAGNSGKGPTTPVRGGSLTIGTMAEIDGFYPASNHWDTNGFLYANTVYDPLMAVAADGSIKPYLARSLTANATFDRWTMTLRPGVRFNDGTALTSAVVKANFDALKASSLATQTLQQMTSIDTPDALTVVFHLAGPTPGLPVGLTTQLGYMVGEAMIAQASSSNASPPTPVGTGPFIYTQWQPGSSFTAARNPRYWRSVYPYLDHITFKPIPDTHQREATLETGGVDLILSIDPKTYGRFDHQAGYQVVDSATKLIGEPTMGFIVLNTAVAPTRDLQIRRALAKGMDQAQLQKLFWGQFIQPVNGLFLPGSPYYSATGYPSFDPSGAKELVTKYKSDHGTPALEILTTPDPGTAQLVQAIQQMWTQVGFDVSIVVAQQADVISDLVTGKFQAVPSAQFGAVDPNLNYPWLSTTTVAPVGSIGLNFPRNSDQRIETAMLASRVATDQAAKVAAWRTVNKRLAEDLPYLWIGQDIFVLAASDRVQSLLDFTLPDGSQGYAYNEGVFFPTQVGLGRH